MEQELHKEGERDYTRDVYQNLMAVIEFIEEKSPMPVAQKQIVEGTGLSKNKVFDICWNLVKRGWAEDSNGCIRLKKGTSEKEAWIGRMVIRTVRDAFGVDLVEKG